MNRRENRVCIYIYLIGLMQPSIDFHIRQTLNQITIEIAIKYFNKSISGRISSCTFILYPYNY